MAYVIRTNTATGSATVGGSTLSKTGSATFEAANDLEIVVTKTTDRTATLPDLPVYYNGETIVFTITMTRTTGSQAALNGITLTDPFPDVVNFTDDAGHSFVQQPVGTKGNVSFNSTTNTVTVTNLVLNNGNPTNTFVITGTIVLP